MRILFRLAIVIVFAALTWFLFSTAREMQGAEQPDHSKIILCFAGIVLLAVLGGSVLAFSVLPAAAESVGNAFFSPNEEIEKSPHSDAQAKMAQGDFPGAIEEYRRAFEADPSDTLALSEIARIYCERLQDFDLAAAALEQALQNEWPHDQAAFLASRLVDVYWKYQHDAVRARPVLIQIVESMPETRHAANATHRLLEIDRALETGALPDQSA